MDRPPATLRAWCAAAAGTAAIVASLLVVAAAAEPEPGRLVLADAPGSVVDVESDDAVVPTDQTTLAPAGAPETTTTTMPPRAQPSRLAPTRPGPLLGAVIVVDPGHNGLNYRYVDVRRAGNIDGDGPLCNTAGSSTVAGLDETTINWEVGTRLAALLRDLGAEVVMTHADNVGFGPCADERGAIARDVAATALVSIHADGASPGSSGFHIIHPAERPGLDPGRVADSRRLATLVRDELVVVGGRPADYVGRNGVQERSDLANLNTADRPAVLAELGNLKNAADAAMLSEPASYDQIARSLARAVVRFVGQPPDDRRLSPDLDGNGLPDYLIGAPQTTTTTTTSTVVPFTLPTVAPNVPLESPTVPEPAAGVADPTTTTVP